VRTALQPGKYGRIDFRLVLIVDWLTALVHLLHGKGTGN
jgi:hypothetical protein